VFESIENASDYIQELAIYAMKENHLTHSSGHLKLQSIEVGQKSPETGNMLPT
jgi:hypothetical protein